MTETASGRDALPMPRPASTHEMLRMASDALAAGIDVCMATVVSRDGSAPATPGQKLVVTGAGSAAGTVGGGAIERVIVERMLSMLAAGDPAPVIESFNLSRDLGMSCGGRVQLVIEPIFAFCPVLVVGGGHVGMATARVLMGLGFRVVVTDERPAALAAERVAAAQGITFVAGKADAAAQLVPTRAAVVVATHAHDLDEAAAIWAIERGHPYVGGVGSEAKARKIRASLASKGLDPARIAALRMPVGLSIGARSPAELAISIAAELVAWRAGQLSQNEQGVKAGG